MKKEFNHKAKTFTEATNTDEVVLRTVTDVLFKTAGTNPELLHSKSGFYEIAMKVAEEAFGDDITTEQSMLIGFVVGSAHVEISRIHSMGPDINGLIDLLGRIKR